MKQWPLYRLYGNPHTAVKVIGRELKRSMIKSAAVGREAMTKKNNTNTQEDINAS